MTTQQDERAELIRKPATAEERAEFQTEFDKLGFLWSDSNQEKAFLGWRLAKAALLEADAKGGEAVAWIDSRDLEALSSYSTQCQVVLHRFPKKAGVALYIRPQQAAQVPLTDQATLAGLESAVGHLSRLFDEQLNMLIQVEKELCVDGHYGPFEDGESQLCDRIRAHIAAHAIGKDQG